MEALYIQPREVGGLMMEEEEQDKNVEQDALEPCSATGSTDEEEDEDSEPQPPAQIRRKVSFADAFGLNLVSVKEFDNAEVTDSVISAPADREETISSDEFYMCCLFIVPSTPEELEQKLHGQMVELESIELLPRTTTLRGIVRVVNLCFNKLVYARITLDRWKSYFDLLAEYVPGSSDRKTDRFTFQYTLVPPFEKEGTRVEFCLRYETSVGTFWANNKQMNYVLFFHQKVKQLEPQVQEELNNYKSKKSCLKFNSHRRENAEEMTRETINSAVYATEAKDTHKAEVTDQNTANRAGTQSSLCCEEHKHTVDSNKSQHRAACLARAQDHCSQRKQPVPQAYSHDLPHSQKGSQPISSVRCNSSSFLCNRSEALTNNSSQVLTYHQIPLLTLDWSNNKPQQCGAAGVDDLWTERAKITLSKEPQGKLKDTATVTNTCDTFLNGTDETTTKESSVFNVWQAFLNASDCKAHSGVSESEWLQTAALVSPSNNEDPCAQCGAPRQVQEFHVGKDIPNLEARTSNACQLLSDTCETSLANVTLNTEDHQPAAACVRSPGDDNTATQDAPQRSQTNSVTETVQEFSLVGATPVSKGSVDSSSECHKHEIWEQEREGIIGGAEGIGGDEPFTTHRADLVTSSGESETTDMTAMPESQNASTVDTISQGARLHEGLSYSRDGKVTGTAYNAMDDTLAFKETIRQGTPNGERFVFSTFRQGVEEGLTTNCAGNKESKKEEIVRPQEIEKCQISQRRVEEQQRQDFSWKSHSLKQHEQNESTAITHVDGLNCNKMHEDHYNQQAAKEFHWEDLESDYGASNMKIVRETETDASCHKTKRLIEAESKIIQVLNEDALPHKGSSSHNLLAWHSENNAMFPEINVTQPSPLAQGEELHGKEEQNPTQRGTETNVTGDSVLVSEMETDCCEIMPERPKPRKEILLSVVTKEEPFPHIEGTLETKKVFQSDTSQSLLTDEYNPEVVEISWTHSHNDITGHKEDVGSGISSEELVLKENVVKKDSSAELQPETLEGIEEDISQRDKDERLRIGKLKIEAMGELMGNVEHPQGESKNAPVKLKEQELSAEVESSPHVEYQKMSAGTKKPIIPDSTVTLERIESELKEMFLERFGQELVRKVWKEVFDHQYNLQASCTHTNLVDRMEDPLKDHTRDDCHLVGPIITSDKKCCETLDSGAFSMNCNEGRPLNTTEEIHLVPHSNTSAHLDNDLNSTVGTQRSPSSTESTQSSPKGQESSERKQRSVTLQEIDSQIEDCAVAYREGCNRLEQPPQKHLSASSKKLEEADGATWWSILYAFAHITRLLICVLLVSVFFLVFFLYDFPTFFALYSFSMCCWIYKWKTYQVIQKQQDSGLDSS